MSDIEQVKKDIMAIAEGIIADAEGSKNSDLVLTSLNNAKEKLNNLRSILPGAK